MEEIKYTYSCCGETHYEWPALAYISPHHDDVLSQEEKDTITELTDDFA